MSVHDGLRSLVDQYGAQVLDQPDDLRGILDDFFAEGEVSSADINLLVDAIRLGGYRRLRTLVAQGADPARAVEAAGSALAAERRGDIDSAGWACAVLGYAVGQVPEQLVHSWPAPGSTTHSPRAPGRSVPEPAPPAPGTLDALPAGPAADGQGPTTQRLGPGAPEPPGYLPEAPGSGRPATAPNRRVRALLVVGLVGLALIVTAVVVLVAVRRPATEAGPPATPTATAPTTTAPTTTAPTTTRPTTTTAAPPAPFESARLWRLAQPYVGPDGTGCVNEPNPDSPFVLEERVGCPAGAGGFRLYFATLGPPSTLHDTRTHFSAQHGSDRGTWTPNSAFGDVTTTGIWVDSLHPTKPEPLIYFDLGEGEAFGFLIAPPGVTESEAHARWVQLTEAAAG